jgi:hypothetical protein|tara:strand:- start:1240 stop:1938 length:699 start_codon:yes stop_codon:yes gene_type:complete
MVCDDAMIPLVRHIVGDWVADPVWQHRPHSPSPFTESREIPIFYVPLHPDDIDRRDSMAWGILYGALCADRVARQLSKWVVPSRYFVSFPYSVYNFMELRKERKQLSSRTPFCISYRGKTFLDGEHLAFTFDGAQLKALVKNFKQQNTNMFKGTTKLPRDERYSGRFYSLSETFKIIEIEDFLKKEAEFYYKIEDWKGYCNYISSEESVMLEESFGAPPKSNKFNKIPKEEK